MSKKTVSIELDGRTYTLETGRFAKFAHSVMVSCEETMVLVTAVASTQEIKDIDYLPLQVEYREKTASAGKIPGGFLKREGRPSDHEVLSSRLIDRPIRPLIPKTWPFDTQIIATVYSANPDVPPETLGALGASAALMISDIPFEGPISEVTLGRIDGEFVLNPSTKQLEQSDIDMTVAGSDTSIMMVEGESKEISEEEFLAALEFAHEKIVELNNLQKKLADLCDVNKREYDENLPPEELVDFLKTKFKSKLKNYVYKVTTKAERSEIRSNILNEALELAKTEFGEKEEYADFNFDLHVGDVVKKVEKNEMREMILSEKRRLDGRMLNEIRPLSCEIGVLPRTHGSALFTRGETQSLSTVTLGTKTDAQMIDGLQPVYTNPFMLHYNFPPFCTGETGRLGTGRREIGHGNLALRAIKAMMPTLEDFPYTVRVVSDILESNGSSSMATVCAGSLSLFDAGVPLKKPVAGIAMGLIKEDDRIAILSDILGDEDFLGDMDFKVAGTKEGITACQMDIKIEGMPIDIMKVALEQAKQGRFFILDVMNRTINAPKDDVSQYAPRYTTFQIPQDTIGAVIGSGGETIRSIVAETDTDININDDGTIVIAATSQESSDRARAIIEELIKKPEEGEIYTGKVKEIREGLGAFVEILPKQQGLLHISQISYDHIVNVSDVLSVGDEIEVKLLEITRDGKFRLSRKALLPKPDGYVEPERKPQRDFHRSPQRGGSGSQGNRRPPQRGGNRR
jgi:polyribonucleotide nucleotidyltransferase